MSGLVKSGKAQSEQLSSGLPPNSDIGRRDQHIRNVPNPDMGKNRPSHFGPSGVIVEESRHCYQFVTKRLARPPFVESGHGRMAPLVHNVARF